jgi:hypothetical protein
MAAYVRSVLGPIEFLEPSSSSHLLKEPRMPELRSHKDWSRPDSNGSFDEDQAEKEVEDGVEEVGLER